jgi:hypothetical protein
MFEVGQEPVDMVRRERAAFTLSLLSRFHHEVFDEQPAMLLEQVRERQISLR